MFGFYRENYLFFVGKKINYLFCNFCNRFEVIRRNVLVKNIDIFVSDVNR